MQIPAFLSWDQLDLGATFVLFSLARATVPAHIEIVDSTLILIFQTIPTIHTNRTTGPSKESLLATLHQGQTKVREHHPKKQRQCLDPFPDF
jgi:hypothetical protein